MFFAPMLALDENDVAEIEGRQLGGIAINGSGRHERSDRRGRIGVHRREGEGWDFHTLVREASMRGASSVMRARSTKGRVILGSPFCG